MKQIVLLGAGKSATILIEYLLKHATNEKWELTIADLNEADTLKKINDNPHGKFVQLDANNENAIEELVIASDIVISMLPAFMHPKVAKMCIKHRKNMVTASYISEEMQALHEDAKQKNIILLNECGLDPGLDHMTAMRVIDDIKSKGYELTGFQTDTGGLLAPESEKSNPWKYKFTWNPRNVVMAASGGAVKFLHEGKIKYIPYHKVFRRTERVDLGELGQFEEYANRDSLKYLDLYNLHGIKTLFRGTLRRPGYCRAWHVFVQLGATDDSYKIQKVENMTHRDFMNLFLRYHPTDSVETKLAQTMRLDMDSNEMIQLEWLGVFNHELVGLKGEATPAQILQHILEKKWSLEPDDKDMIVMWHKFNYLAHGEEKEIQSVMAVYGESESHTAMAKTVGFPVAIAVKNILNGTIQEKGVHLPVIKSIYDPILNELESMGIKTEEKQIK